MLSAVKRGRSFKIVRFQRLAQVSRAEVRPIIPALDLNQAAHLEKTGSHALSDAITESFFAVGAAGRIDGGAGAIHEVGGDDGSEIGVVTRVEDEADRIPNPLGRLNGAEVIEQQDFGLEDRAQDFELGGLDRWVVGILNLLEEFAVIAKAGVDAFGRQFFESCDREMSFADAAWANEEESCAVERILIRPFFKRDASNG